jgi:hypothetical protein
MGELIRRIRYLLSRRRLERELREEMEAHRAQAEAEGRRFGEPLRLREEAQDAWGFGGLDRLAQDVRYAVRRLRRAPGFTAGAVLVLALGIGVNVAAFGFFNAAVLRPLAVRDPGSLLRFERKRRGRAPTTCRTRPWPSTVSTRARSPPCSPRARRAWCSRAPTSGCGCAS